MRLSYVLVVMCAVILQVSSTALPETKGSETMIKDGDSPDTVDGFQADGGRRLGGKDSFFSFLAKEFKAKFFWTRAYKEKQILKQQDRDSRNWFNVMNSMTNKKSPGRS
ncbi:hypothetical protein PI124_g12147 [Phytophthora idaei]|nr:hypothetical protein PI125_g10835 [Phytophthora idaei]KAG3166287.1 hypothetical protein PI126_g4260 [Phytophthora idaei]KAG3243027.1 hypothetical protein PI124_g12147 [Phytophthora idaei]